MNTPKNNLVWLITGASSGLGHALAGEVLRHGHRVIMTGRSTAPMHALAKSFPETSLVAPLDITQPDQVAAVVREAEAHFNSIDVLVNNAGVGYLAAIEEGEDADIRWQFETNFFGTAAMIRAILPGMRRRGRGIIINISSSGGFIGVAGLGYYNASKCALEGLTEALWQEVEPLGIKVLLVEPGGFRTGMVQRNRVGRGISAYSKTAGAFRSFVQHANEEIFLGDPARAATAIHKIVEAEEKPHRLALGSDSYDGIIARIDALRPEYEAWEEFSRSTDVPPGAVVAPVGP